jgi:hypothetical protein
MPACIAFKRAAALPLLFALSVATAAPSVTPQPPDPPTRADVERLVQKAQEYARVAEEHARAQAREAERQALAQLDFDLDYGNLAFIGSELGTTREIVKNAPYTADAVSETVQLLQDGNRIVKRTTTKLARDTYGRTRQEKAGPHGTVAYIFDPIDNRNFALNVQRKSAVRIPRTPDIGVPPGMPFPPPGVTPPPPAAPAPPLPPGAAAPGMPSPAAIAIDGDRVAVRRRGDETREPDDVRIEVLRIARDGPDVAALGPMPTVIPLLPRDKGERKSLGTRDFEGVKADGTQTTHTIPAGAIGNERPIVITSERWFSPELQLVVYARTFDPRAGETTYRLTNVKRGEPSADLFKVPPDYRLRSEPRG